MAKDCTYIIRSTYSNKTEQLDSPTDKLKYHSIFNLKFVRNLGEKQLTHTFTYIITGN